MRHIFIVNPAAGQSSHLEEIKNKLKALKDRHHAEIYITKAPLDATDYVRRRCLESPDEKMRFYACGGDGTLNEVVAGVIGAENAEVSCYPCGSGNDYVKCFGGASHFLDLEKLMESRSVPVDAMKVCGRYCINVCNFGFDAVVAETMASVRRKKIIGGKNAYTTGIAKALFTARDNECRVYADGELLNPEGRMLLCTVANGQYVGGSYRCAPRSLCNDGLLEVCLIKPMPLTKYLTLIKSYSEGKHLDDSRFANHLMYRRAKKVEVFAATEDFGVCLDGEMTKAEHYSVEVLYRAVRFAAPTLPVATKRVEEISEATK